jgi:hypothetical protein
MGSCCKMLYVQGGIALCKAEVLIMMFVPEKWLPLYQLLASINLSVASYKGILFDSVHHIVIYCFLHCFVWPTSTYGFWLPLWFLQTFLLYFDDELLFAQTHCCNEQRNTTGKQYFTFNTKEGNKHVVASI